MIPPHFFVVERCINIHNKHFWGIHFKEVFAKFNRLTAEKTLFISVYGITDLRQRGKYGY